MELAWQPPALCQGTEGCPVLIYPGWRAEPVCCVLGNPHPTKFVQNHPV